MSVEMRFDSYVKNPEVIKAMLVTPEILALLPKMTKEDILYLFRENLTFEWAGNYVVMINNDSVFRKSLISVGDYIVNSFNHNLVYRADMCDQYLKLEKSNE